jgi:hypothetical protein
MRFMLLVIPKAYESADADFTPPADLVAKMTKFNQSMIDAGIVLDMNGLRPPPQAARIVFGKGTSSVTDGPFAEAKEMVGGYWTIKVNSRDEAIAWARKAPMLEGDTIEVRQIQEMEDFPPDVQRAAGH